MIFNISSIVPLLTTLSFTIILIVLLRAEKNRTNRAFFYYIFANIIWSFGSFMMHLNPPILSPLFWNRFMVTALLVIPMLYYDFACKYTLQQNKLLNFNIFAYFFLEILNLFGLIVSQARFENDIFIYKPGSLILVAYGVDYIIMVLAALTLIVSHRKEDNLSRKIGLRYVITGSFILMAGTLANLSPSLGSYPIDILSNLLNALLISHAIFRFKFVRLRKVTRKLIIYLLTISILIFSITIATYPIVNYIFYYISIVPINGIFLIVFSITLILSLLFEPVKRLIEQNIFKHYQLIDCRIKTSIERYLVCNDISEFDNLYKDDLKLITNCDDVFSFYYDKNKKSFTFLDSSGKAISLQISEESMLIDYFNKNAKPIFSSSIDILPVFTGITKEERKFIESEKIGLITPISFRDEILVISFIKIDEERFIEDPEILDYLNKLGLNLNIILKNIILIENLKLANEEIKSIAEKRDNFVNRIVHDIKNYITVIVQASKMLLYEDLKREDKETLPNIILRESNELILLLNNLLNLSKIEFNGLKLNKEYFRIIPFLKGVAETNSLRAKEKNIKINLNILSDNEKIYADINKLKEVLDNLLINSIKFSPINSEILLSFYKIKNNYYFSVRNSGPKISESSLKDIFNIYSQSNSNPYKGFGIGLSVVKEIVNLHGGETYAENLEEGVEFIFYIPSSDPNSQGNVK